MTGTHPALRAGARTAALLGMLDRIEALHALRSKKDREIARVYAEMRAEGLAPPGRKAPKPTGRRRSFASLDGLGPRRARDGSKSVYFLAAHDAGLIKIGCSNAPERRTRSLQTTSPVTLKVLAIVPGGRRREGELHRQFAALRAHGEWFRAEPALIDFIAGVSA